MQRIFRRSVLLILTASLCAAAQAQTAGKIPEDVAAFTARTSEILRKKDWAALRMLGHKPNSLKWTTDEAGFFPLAWKAAALELPGRPGSFLLSIHDFHTCEGESDHLHPLIKTPGGWKIGDEIAETDHRGYRVRDHDLKVQYDLKARSAVITDKVLVEKTSQTGSPCILRLSADFKVTKVTSQGRPFEVRFVPGAIVFEMPEQKVTLEMEYEGSVFHPFSDYITDKESVLVSYWYPHIGRLPAKHGVTATVPKGWTVVGQGDLKEKREEGDTVTFSYRNEIATCYFSLDAGPYTVTSREVGGRTFSVYLLRHNDDLAKRSLDRLEKCLPWFEERFGPYPYKTYGLVQTLQPFGGALEAYSFSTYGPGSLPGALEHEVAHTWWGGIVPCTYTRTMWNESFASYSDGLFRRQTSSTVPPKALSGMHQGRDGGRGSLRQFRVPMSQAWSTSVGSHGATGYGKGSLVLAMLEDLLGTADMVKAMRRYHDDHQPGEPGEWSEFERAVKRATGKDYGWFFRQWVERPGVPVVRLSGIQSRKKGAQWEVTGRIEQVGTPYRLSIPLLAKLKDGEAASVVEVRSAATSFRITAKSQPISLKLDPAGNILLASADEKGETLSHTFP
jgi:aminopeptidase N